MRGFIVPIVLFCIILLVVVVFGVFIDSESSGEEDHDAASSFIPVHGPPLHPKPKSETALVAAPDGTIYFVEIASGKILWSFASGPSIYSSYQALPDREGETENDSAEGDNFYIDVGEDWELYIHGNGIKKVKLPFTIEELMRRTPLTTPGGGILLGSKKSTVFIVDAKTGKVIHTIRSDNITYVDNQEDGENAILPWMERWGASNIADLDLGVFDEILYITRNDYTLSYTSTKTGRTLWYLNFADIETSLKCDGVENFLAAINFKSMGSDPGQKLDLTLPYHCSTRPVIYRIRERGSLESLFKVSRSINALPGEKLLFLPSSGFKPMLRPAQNLLDFDGKKEDDTLLALPGPEATDNKILALPQAAIGQKNITGDSGFFTTYRFWPLILAGMVTLAFTGLRSYLRHLSLNKSSKSDEVAEQMKIQSLASKKKKARRPGFSKKSSGLIKEQKDDSNEQSVSLTNNIQDGGSRMISQLDLSYGSDDITSLRKIGRLFLSSKEIAKGSNGTVVLEGIYDGRVVAVKRLVKSHHDVASKEIQNLIASDQHPNIVRWYGVEYDQDFVYLALERCECSLHDLILLHSTSSHGYIASVGEGTMSGRDQSFRLELNIKIRNDIDLWKPNGYPSSHLLKLTRDVVNGVAHLHELGIVHRDLKPQNVLVVKERSLCAKISDMGISKRLAGNMTSLTKHTSGYGSSGWQAPEQLLNERQTRAVDLFSLGCLLFFCITGGQHPFGSSLERDANIVNNRKDLFLIDNLPEATDLIASLLNPTPDLRPKAIEVMIHPLFWNSERRLWFLRDASDRVELEDREKESQLLKALESKGEIAFKGNWNEKLDNSFLDDMRRYRRYKFDSVRDLLRVIRNKLNHFRQLSKEMQGVLGPIPEGFDTYFSTRFPKLLIEVYKVFYMYCSEEESFRKYFISDQI